MFLLIANFYRQDLFKISRFSHNKVPNETKSCKYLYLYYFNYLNFSSVAAEPLSES